MTYVGYAIFYPCSRGNVGVGRKFWARGQVAAVKIPIILSRVVLAFHVSFYILFVEEYVPELAFGVQLRLVVEIRERRPCAAVPVGVRARPCKRRM